MADTKILFDEYGLEGALEIRASSIREWLGESGAECESEQKHLDEATPERIYWHYGYLVALQDIVRHLRTKPTSISRKSYI